MRAPTVLFLAGLGLATSSPVLDRHASTLSFTSSTSSSLPTVKLDYSTIQASSSASVDAGKFYKFSNIRFAAAPVGNLRWAAPQPPVIETKINNGTWATNGTTGCSVAEDCLFLDVYVPENALKGGKKLPVLFWNYGGGWRVGSKAVSPAGLFNVSNNGLIIVAYNYRLNIFGVLNGPTLQQSGGVSNVALYDAHAAMEWTSKYISKFGGDPSEITNWGFSAGGTQVLTALTAFGGHNWTPKFKRAKIDSPGLVPGAGHEHAERYLQNVTASVNCPWSKDTIACLRNVSFPALLAAASNITSTYKYQLQPRVDAVVLPDTSEYLLSIGQYHKVVDVMLGHSSNESSPSFAPNLTTEADLRSTLQLVFPSITTWAMDQLVELYPIGKYGTYTNVLQVMQHTYELPGKLLPTTLAFKNQTYNYISTLGQAKHGSDQTYFWYDPTATVVDPASSPNATQAALAVQMQKWLCSFVIHGNPNTLFANKLGDGVGEAVETWPKYGSNETVLRFADGGFALVGDELANERTQWWNKVLWY